jgi:catechol 2,3-dioxygenase-like lactoylglutathione lyase family enzyme
MAELTLTTITLGAPDPVALARFYNRLLGWDLPIDETEPDWVALRRPGQLTLAFQQEPLQPPPVWPATSPDDQQIMAHLEIRVDDLDAAVAHALACGARLAEQQPQDDVRVCLDPTGRPFCLWVPS